MILVLTGAGLVNFISSKSNSWIFNFLYGSFVTYRPGHAYVGPGMILLVASICMIPFYFFKYSVPALKQKRSRRS